MIRGVNRLGLGLVEFGDGKSERIVAIDPAGRVARAHVKVAVGDVLVGIGGCPATRAKVELTEGSARLSTGAVWITILAPGGREPTTIELPPLDASSMEIEIIDQVSNNDPLYEISAEPPDTVEAQELAAAAASPQSEQMRPSEAWAPEQSQSTKARALHGDPGLAGLGP
jgi:hypothetical protein